MPKKEEGRNRPGRKKSVDRLHAENSKIQGWDVSSSRSKRARDVGRAFSPALGYGTYPYGAGKERDRKKCELD